MRKQRRVPQMRACRSCGTEWFSDVHLTDSPSVCELCGSTLVQEAVRPASELDLVFGPFLWRADQPPAA